MQIEVDEVISIAVPSSSYVSHFPLPPPLPPKGINGIQLQTNPSYCSVERAH